MENNNMLIKHYTLDGTLAVIEGVTDIWVYPNDKTTISTSNDFFAYASEELTQPHAVVQYTKDETPYTVRVFEGITVYICNDEGKTIEKVQI